MLQYQLVSKDHPALKTVSTEVPHGENRYQLIESMFFHLKCNGRGMQGVGLAANQLGVTERIIVIECNGIRQEFINPVIVRLWGGKNISKEGCLSFPGVIVNRIRMNQCHVVGYDRTWKEVGFKFKNLNAYIIQHEVDHLNGRTILDS